MAFLIHKSITGENITSAAGKNLLARAPKFPQSAALELPMFQVKIIFLGFSILLTGCLVNFTKQSGLFGVWKSNEAKALDSMRRVVGVSEKAKELFENDFFGHLIAECRADEGRYYFDREEDNIEGMKEFIEI
ncbi:hypothetical protein QWI17_21965 [Gilvimarinus sp. SDUM040013]|uniref:Uncharacterized protein n=1 Tax=Gilvimarinus gilvus TaxID=3058038 RepID=A0ABU4RVA2_9GAMM|nr:hypothetical protein [Gilvimarinus sp. SDUM040013]MDO3388529.1 hypothetical protein [Gilvimarinus sp. SDUM040013]MDX6848599.1 hypothetical protein [Gilvimarinus sp. SDUM040013]